ncbi:transposase [Companilactobacillus sp. HBUAS56275]|jgi:Transposase and inactivated derivatives|uniref:Transposase n=1 Tax=Candidatus Companilactobacillus pullicola TaxID=2838523 RepID=A0A9D1ZQH8_9LACO|nr:transposase [Candidatus Companilactobacillus pullicola]
MRRYEPEFKIKAVKDYLKMKSEVVFAEYCRSIEVSSSTVKGWLVLFNGYGEKGLRSQAPKKYDYETKIQATSAYLNGEGTLDEIAIRFKLRSSKQLRYWIIQYNNDKNLIKATPVRKKVITMSKKTTLEERIEVVEYVTLQKHSYTEASVHFHVSYQQVRNWVLLVKNQGYSALADKRGHRGYVKEKDLTETDELKLEIKQLKAELNKRDAIEAFEKKFNEIQRGE